MRNPLLRVLGIGEPTPPPPPTATTRRRRDYALAPVVVNGELQWVNDVSGALTLPTFYRCRQILGDVGSSLPWEAVRGGPYTDQATQRSPERVDPQPRMLVDPSPFMTALETRRAVIDSLVMRGNAYLLLAGYVSGFPTIVTPIHPDEVSVTWSDERHMGRDYEWRGTPMVEGLGGNLLHIRMLPNPGSPYGLSPLDAARLTVQYGQEERDFGGRFFGDSAMPAGTLMHPGRLDANEALELLESWDTQHKISRGTAVLSSGMEYKPLSISPENAQFLQTRAFTNQQIATLMGVPTFFTNAGSPPGTASSLTYTNLSMVFRELYQLTLAPSYLSRIRDGFTRVLPRGQTIQFDTSELLSLADNERWQSLTVALDAGILTMDEVREREGLPPLAEDEIPEPEPPPSVSPATTESSETLPSPEPITEEVDA